MKIVCDPDKDAENRRKHGISLYEAASIDWDAALFWQDTRHDYGEVRMVALGIIGERLYCVVYVDRNDARRVISLRKANFKETMAYANQN